MRLMEVIVSRGNMVRALRRVEANKGAPGIDKMTVEQLGPYLKAHWARIRQDLLSGQFRPSPVRGVNIPKPGGGVRTLGIPTVLDRLIQQAIQQVLTPIFDPGFSNSSYGFRPRRSAHDAVLAAQSHIEAGHRFVVDIDLEKFFDRVNHDVLMARVARKVPDLRVLRVIRSFLQAGMMTGGLASARTEGTPQGGRSRLCSRTSCSTTSTRNSNAAATSSAGTPTTVTSMFGRGAPGSAPWPRSPASLPDVSG
jgi:RNA-directed DNA polymerase